MNDKPASKSPEVVTSKGIGSSALLGDFFLFRDKLPRKYQAIRVVNTDDPTEKPREVWWNGTRDNLPHAWQPIDFSA